MMFSSYCSLPSGRGAEGSSEAIGIADEKKKRDPD
jgi:hypothetical protein